MAFDSVLVDNFVNSADNTLETIFTASADTMINAVTITNITNVNAAFTLNIVPADGDTTKPEIPYRVVIRQKSDLAVEVLNHVIPSGGSLRALSSTAGSLSFRVTGRLLTD